MMGTRRRLVLKLEQEYDDATTELSARNKYVAEQSMRGDTAAANAARSEARQARKRVKELTVYIDWLTHLIEN